MVHLPDLIELKGYVRNVLCARADLESGTPLLESHLLRRGKPCGLEYTLLAPRAVRLSAVWDGLASRVFFYDQDLERFQTTDVAGPTLAQLGSHELERVQIKSMWRGK